MAQLTRAIRLGRRAGRVVLLSAVLLIAQLGVATHPLHFDAKQNGQKVELTCSFCLAGSNFSGTAPTLVIHFERITHSLDAISHSERLASSYPLTPRLTRGPPLSIA